MTPDEQALLKEIAANLDVDPPRLAFADWLDETADEIVGPTPEKTLLKERAEFIRRQIDLANTPPLTRKHSELQAESDRLLKNNRLTWLRAAFPGMPADMLEEMQDDFTFDRGFPSRLRVMKENFQEVLEHAGALFNGTCIDTLDVHHVFGFLPTLMHRLDEDETKIGQAGGTWNPPHFTKVILENYFGHALGGVAWAGEYDDNAPANVDDLNALATRPEFSKLHTLRMNNNGEDDYTAALQYLMSSPNMTHLQRLELGNVISNQSPLDIHGGSLPSLRYFGIFHENLESGRRGSLRITEDDYTEDNYTEDYYTAMLQSGPQNPVFQSMEFVDFSGTAPEIDTHEHQTQACDALLNAWCEHCPKLKGMALSYEILDNTSGTTLHRLMHKVETLRLDGAGHKPDKVAAAVKESLAQTDATSTLKEVQVTGVQLTPDQAKQLLDRLPEGAWLNAELSETKSMAAAEVLNRMDARRDSTPAASPPSLDSPANHAERDALRPPRGGPD